ncbi:chlorophyll synthase ChlG [Acetobacteraceae bacterium KSS8]|uniref:Chlorophyll synthase ChlG n=1 Tax=Endosaccharibacter trunci TaxID=2812733 RepID=A0ABT1W3Q0_9PROT|nr:chlorophyll synthase ChlG [Acetobacteraceae bacterium KSS8]
MSATLAPRRGTIAPAALLELLKPITWFAPVWAFGCGVLSAGVPLGRCWPVALLGAVLAGPLLCGASQATNDWFDRHVDAINQPERPIPSGRIPGRWGLAIAIGWSLLALAASWSLGRVVFAAAACGTVLAWCYSAPPLRLKSNGWFGNLAVGVSYEGLSWFAGAAAAAGAMPGERTILLAALYSLATFGIMILNDFKSVGGDTVLRLRSLPVQLGVGRAARLACMAMAVPQVLVIALLLRWQAPIHAGAVGLLLLAQFALMPRLLRAPEREAVRYNATGTSLLVLGMLAAALALRVQG